MSPEDYMLEAYKQALEAYKEDEVPVGAIIVYKGDIIAKTHNKKEYYHDSTKHAEILAIQEASKYLEHWQLDQCELYVTLEPCCMCAGACIQSRIKKVYYGARDYKGGFVSSLASVFQVNGINHKPDQEYLPLNNECSILLTNYFQGKRKNKKGGSGNGI